MLDSLVEACVIDSLVVACFLGSLIGHIAITTWSLIGLVFEMLD